MSFTNPSFLWAFFALAIPIIIHLFDFQRPKKVLFTNVRFLHAINQQTNQARKLKSYLLLLSRLLFLFFLIMAFCQPFWGSTENKITNPEAIKQVYIDNSMSMKSTLDGKLLFDKAIDQSLKVINLHSASSKYQLFTNDIASKQVLTKSKIADQLSEIRLSTSSMLMSNLVDKMNYYKESLNEGTATQFIYSDFQKSTVGSLKQLNFDSTSTIYLLPMRPDAGLDNIYVDSVWIKNYFLRKAEKNTISVKVKRSGGVEKVRKNVKFYINEAMQSGSVVELEPNQATVLDFDLLVSSDSTLLCTIKVDDQPSDFDNTFYFSLEPVSTVSILEISKSKNPYFEKLYSGEDQFVYKRNMMGKVSLRDIERADLIIIDGFDELSEMDLDQIISFKSDHKTIVLIPSDAPVVQVCRNSYIKWKIPLEVDQALREKLSLALPEASNPFFNQVFERQDQNLLMPFGYPALDLKNKGRSLLKYNNGLFFATNYAAKDHEFILFASALSPNETDFCNHALFVALFYRIAISATKNLNPIYYLAGSSQNYTYRSELANKERSIVLKSKNTEFVPSYKMASSVLSMNIPSQAKEAGFYEVYENGTRKGTFALNFEKNESILDYYSIEELKSEFGAEKNIVIASDATDDDFVKSYSKANFGVEWWKYCLVAALFFLFCEILIIRFLK